MQTITAVFDVDESFSFKEITILKTPDAAERTIRRVQFNALLAMKS